MIKKIFILFFLIVIFVFLFNRSKDQDVIVIKEEIHQYLQPVSLNVDVDLDSLLDSYFENIDSLDFFYTIIKDYDSLGSLKSYRFFNNQNKLFAQECFWFNDRIKDSLICSDFDYYRDWDVVSFQNKQRKNGKRIVVIDTYLNPNGTRTVFYYHGQGCACCSEGDLSSVNVVFHPYDDPRKELNKFKYEDDLYAVDSTFVKSYNDSLRLVVYIKDNNTKVKALISKETKNNY